MGAPKDQKHHGTAWHMATQLVHAGTLRSQFGETSEAIFLNSGYVYQSAEQAEARFKGDEEGFVYSRYANPTVAMFEARMCALEGADAARGTASGMAAVAASLLCHLKAGDHVVSGRALFGSENPIGRRLAQELVEVLPICGIFARKTRRAHARRAAEVEHPPAPRLTSRR